MSTANRSSPSQYNLHVFFLYYISFFILETQFVTINVLLQYHYVTAAVTPVTWLQSTVKNKKLLAEQHLKHTVADIKTAVSLLDNMSMVFHNSAPTMRMEHLKYIAPSCYSGRWTARKGKTLWVDHSERFKNALPTLFSYGTVCMCSVCLSLRQGCQTHLKLMLLPVTL